MSKTATDIIKRALTLVDERVTDILDASSVEMSLTDMAAEILPEVARSLIKELPYDLKRYLAKPNPAALVADTLANGEVQTPYTKKKVSFTAPTDFYELVALRLTVWARPVVSYIYNDSPEYAIQCNPFTRAGKQNPVVATTNTSTGSAQRIECFSVHGSDAQTVADFQYISFANVPDNSTNPWPDELFDKITRALASELNVIKGRLQEGELQGQEAMKSIEQHE
ncbi:MAG: hypothetical protein PHT07_20925 [Paludibacter sp.]|nr:hypothetical protein [Paludibacter sp.]